jgi:hypothetical protein
VLSRKTRSLLSEESIDNMIQDIKNEKIKEIFYSKEEKDLIFKVVTKLLRSIYHPLLVEDSNNKFLKNNDSEFLAMKLKYIKEKFKSQNWFLKMRVNLDSTELLKGKIIPLMKAKINDQRFLFLSEKMIEWMDENQKTTEMISFKDILTEILLLSFVKEEKKRITDYCIHQTEIIIPLSEEIKNSSKIKEKGEGFLKNFQFEEKNFKVTVININDKRLDFANIQLVKRNKDKIDLLMPTSVIQKKLKPFLKNKKPVHLNKRLHLSVERIHQEFEKDYQELKENYHMTENYNVRIKKFKYYHQLSLLKTIALKEKTSVKKVKSRYKKLL